MLAASVKMVLSILVAAAVSVPVELPSKRWKLDEANHTVTHKRLGIGFPLSIGQYHLAECRDLRDAKTSGGCTYISAADGIRAAIMIHHYKDLGGINAEEAALLTISAAALSGGGESGGGFEFDLTLGIELRAAKATVVSAAPVKQDRPQLWLGLSYGDYVVLAMGKADKRLEPEPMAAVLRDLLENLNWPPLHWVERDGGG